MSRAGRRYYRTIILGVFALAGLVWVAMDQFGVAREEMLELFLASLLVLLLVIGCAGVATLLWLGLRKLWRRGGG